MAFPAAAMRGGAIDEGRERIGAGVRCPSPSVVPSTVPSVRHDSQPEHPEIRREVTPSVSPEGRDIAYCDAGHEGRPRPRQTLVDVFYPVRNLAESSMLARQ